MALFVVAIGALGADDPVVFKSEVAMTRVDAQVVDAAGRPITGLRASDFVLRVDGKPQPIRNFISEDMPVDVLLLLDVSGSMEPHIQRIADASEAALGVLAPADRVAIMVFDTHARLRLPFESDHGQISDELHSLLRSERFNGGTRITGALVDAANYLKREGRANARRAIVILTDDETQDAEDEPRVEQALDEANAVLSFLRAPYEEQFVPGRRGPRHSGGGGPWGGGNAPWPGSPWPGGGSRLPGGVTLGGGDPSHSAGTAEIAKDSGGDVMPVDAASAFEDTLARLRQRYALYFYWPPSQAKPEERLVTVALSKSAGNEYSRAEVHYRRAYLGQASGRNSGTLMEVSREPDALDAQSKDANDRSTDVRSSSISGRPRRRAVNEDADTGPILMPDDNDSQQGSTARTQPPARTSAPATPAPTPRKGWPSVDETTEQH